MRTLAAALAPKKAPEEGQPRPAVVVIGNSAFATNAFFNFPGNTDFFLHTVGHDVTGAVLALDLEHNPDTASGTMRRFSNQERSIAPNGSIIANPCRCASSAAPC